MNEIINFILSPFGIMALPFFIMTLVAVWPEFDGDKYWIHYGDGIACMTVSITLGVLGSVFLDEASKGQVFAASGAVNLIAVLACLKVVSLANEAEQRSLK